MALERFTDSSKASSPDSTTYCFLFTISIIFSFPYNLPLAAYVFFIVFPYLLYSVQ